MFSYQLRLLMFYVLILSFPLRFSGIACLFVALSTVPFLRYTPMRNPDLPCRNLMHSPCSSGIGRSIAILMARENADVSIVYLPDEQEDAEKTKQAVEAENQSCLLLPGNLMDNRTCKDAVDQHVKKYVSSTLGWERIEMITRY